MFSGGAFSANARAPSAPGQARTPTLQRLRPSEIVIVLVLVVLILVGKNPKHLAAELQQALQRLPYYQPKPHPDLRGLEWLVLVVVILFLELIWVSSRV